MTRVLPQRLRLLAAAVLFAGTAATRAQEQIPGPPVRPKGANAAKGPKGARASRAAEDAVRSALPAELTQHFPIGRVFKGVAIPSYTGDKLKSVITADSVTRVDERFLDLANLVVKVYNAAGQHEATISMDVAAYDLVADELASKTPSTIEQPRFTMTGDTMIFHNQSQVARLVGNVRLVVPDASRLAPDFGLPGDRRGERQTP